MQLNFQAYEVLYFIENRLRKILIDFLGSELVPNASHLFELNIPENSKNRIIDFVKSISASKKSNSFIDSEIVYSDDEILLLRLYKEFLGLKQKSIRLYNPVFYLTTSELNGIFKKDIIKAAFVSQFGSEHLKTFFILFDNILFIRNDIAHNRNISSGDYNALILFLNFIEQNLGLNTSLESLDQLEDLSLNLKDIKIFYSDFNDTIKLRKENLEHLQTCLKKLKTSVWTSLFYSGILENIVHASDKVCLYSNILKIPDGALQLQNIHSKLMKNLEEIIQFYE